LIEDLGIEELVRDFAPLIRLDSVSLGLAPVNTSNRNSFEVGNEIGVDSIGHIWKAFQRFEPRARFSMAAQIYLRAADGFDGRCELQVPFLQLNEVNHSPEKF
jgi:hypothetical protein